mmetsp:Transcript_33015/g.72407  ORF Transcript_33015/g.72407 Transcript_33015/m.72407 type:complete len:469 (+) Transcript_33015:157-1563(+)|eukprot:CAMPEP_0178529354 /NCGR_PEP_ID=MMETSP0696-20121128/32287_1 /TAXON_ID=265572 /ORGANISM="Extubocellulus spinifer, Strain CCMP396" /LENGTH=468 /DNA_ID=CAMNT_0020161061 /DNA_START=89 /DNA_END=1495 /DNA_ORIENTATION=-
MVRVTKSLCLLAASASFRGVSGADGIGRGGLRKMIEGGEDDIASDYWSAPIPDLGLTCIDNSIRAGGGKPLTTCITDGEALCVEYDDHRYFGGRWTFGIKDREIMLWNPRNEMVWSWCMEASHICIGEEHGYQKDRYSNERPFMFFFDQKTQRRVGELKCDGTDGIGDRNLGQSSILKLVDNSNLGQYVNYPVTAVKFKKGQTEDPTDDNFLWRVVFDPTNPQMDHWDGIDTAGAWEYNENKCTWEEQCPSNAPSTIPSSEPSMDPTSVPSAMPSRQPSGEPSTHPSGMPSSMPSSAPSEMPSLDCEVTVKITCVATNDGGTTHTDCDAIEKCDTMGSPNCKWDLQWQYTITNDCDKVSTITALDSTLCHAHCLGGMPGDCLDQTTTPMCDAIDVDDVQFPNGSKNVMANGEIVAVYDWPEEINLGMMMTGVKAFGNVTVELETSDGRDRSGTDKACVEICDKSVDAP